MRSTVFLLPYVAVISLVYIWQSGGMWAIWPLVGILACLAIYSAVAIVRRPHRVKPPGYVGKFKRADGTVVHVSRMESGKLWAASDTQPPYEIGYIEGREMMRWERLGSTPD